MASRERVEIGPFSGIIHVQDHGTMNWIYFPENDLKIWSEIGRAIDLDLMISDIRFHAVGLIAWDCIGCCIFQSKEGCLEFAKRLSQALLGCDTAEKIVDMQERRALGMKPPK